MGMVKEVLQIKKWLNEITNILFYFCLFVVILVVLQVFVVTSFRIPSDSMEPSLLAGDYILVDKCSGGARLFDVLDAVEKKEVVIHRMPSWKNYQRNDVLVFNFPYLENHWDSIALDVMKYYVKRCIALPGDTLEIRNGYYKIYGVLGNVGNLIAQRQMSELPDSGTSVVMSSFPGGNRLKWTVKEFGPLSIPAKGQVVGMDSTSWLLYRQLISWEQKKRLCIDADNRVYLGDSLIQEYHFRENYYFVSGDKMENSKDSRYWGLLPEPFIVGKAWRIWKSVDNMSENIRWERIWKKID